ncbi:MAG: DUF192 domain-containing protein, partial [Planctomycetota bacterium]
LHPDCVVAMGEVPRARSHSADPDERLLAAAVREAVPVPAPDRTLAVVAGGRRIDVAVETRDTVNAIWTGMMMRQRFDGEDRGMLFVYRHREYRSFFMLNCFVPIDLAYIRDGRIDQIVPMEPQVGALPDALRYYESRAAVRHVLEMPAGWFQRHGVEAGASVEGLP